MHEQLQVPDQRELSVGQRVAYRLLAHFAADLDRGSVAEQHTAAAMTLVVDSIARGYEAELVALVRAWRLEREGGSDGQAV